MNRTNMRDTGHDKNLNNFMGLVQFCTTLGERYQPSRSDITLVAMNNAATQAKTLLDQLHEVEITLSQAIVTRQQAFEALPKLATRILNLLRASKTGSEVLRMARHYSGKLHAKRLGKDPAVPENKEGETQQPAKRISAIQSSYDSMLSHFEQMVRTAETETAYMPNEADMKIESLHQLVDLLAGLNGKVVELTNRRRTLISERQHRFYDPAVSLLAISRAARSYITAIYGVRSKEEKAANAFLLIKV